MVKAGVFDRDEAERIRIEANRLKEANELVVKANVPLVDEVRAQTVQSSSPTQMTSPVDEVLGKSLSFIYQSGDILPPWWSTQRDIALSAFWKQVNLLSGAMFTMTSKMTTIPFHIEPVDMAINSHFKEAAKFEKRLHDSAELGMGWGQFFAKQIQSLLGQDNGRFMEIIDMSPSKLKPLLGPAISVAHLDPSRCTRTKNREYPVLYRDDENKQHRLHWTRVAFGAQLPSERAEMLGVGLCAVSRASSYAQNVLDICKYKEEKLGSRPTRGLMLVGGGLDAERVGQALGIAQGLTDNMGLSRFSTVPIVGNSDIDNPSINLISLSSLPDGFTEKDATDIAMAAIALAFGVDARELWPGLQSGATRADALLQHIKQRGKGPGQIIIETERMFNNWYLPPYLRMVFDYQDDAQDRQRAEIDKERALKRKTDLSMKVTDERVEREIMTNTGSLTTAQFEDLELESGRLASGLPVETVFYLDEPIYNEILNIPGLSDPLDIRSNDPEKALDAISKQTSVAIRIIATETRQIQQRQARESLAALQSLQRKYEEALHTTMLENESVPQLPPSPPSENRQGIREKAPSNREDESLMNVRPSDEANLSSENSPRDLKKDGSTQLEFTFPEKKSLSDRISSIFYQ